MVDIKRQDITLQDRTKGISADEFAWGSYFYSEGIQTGYNTKWFKLWHRLDSSVLNYRENGYPVAISPIGYYGMTIFCHDRRLETSETYNGGNSGNIGGAIYAQQNKTKNWVNWVVYGNQAIIIRESAIDMIEPDSLFNPASELLTNTDLSDGTGWTLWAWRTITSEGAKHTPGSTDPLTTDFTGLASQNCRLAIKISGRTAWRVGLGIGGEEENTDANGRFVVTDLHPAAPATFTITPTSTFDGTIEIATLHDIDYSYVNLDIATITTAESHPCVIWGGDLYIWSWNKVDIVSLQDRGVTTKTLVDENETIVDITQQAGNLIIWATDGYNSRQYYRNGVDAVATEAIEWKWLIVKAVTNTETVCYVLTTSGSTTGTINGYQYRLYAVSWYQRNLLANKTYYPDSRSNVNQEPYNIQKKFDFNDVSSSKSMCMFLDWLFIPGCDWVYKYGNEIPWMRSSWSRPVRYPYGATNVILGQNGVYFCICYTLDGVNYFWQINEQRYTPTWYLVSEGIYRDKLSTRKALEKLKIWYKNVASEDGNIKIYAIVDDDYFWRFNVTWITNRPNIGDTYTVANQTTAEVINIDKTNNIITFRTVNNLGSYANTANSTLTKVSGDGDNSITTTWYDNMVLVKTIESGQQEYGSDLIFWKNFVNNYIPYRHKIQFVIELNSIDNKLTPEIYEISMVSDITDVTL